MAASSSNKLDFLQGVQLMPWEWANLGALWGRPARDHEQLVAARCAFVVRRGFDEVEQLEYGNVTEGLGDVGFNLRAKGTAFHLGASNLSYKTGTDVPLRAQSLVGNTLASLKLAYAQEVAEDRFVALSYDVKQRKPELSVAWAGDSFTERASLAVSLDPVDRALRVRAGVVFPGPEWREDVYNEATRRVEVVRQDAGSRHSLWVDHEMRLGELLAATKLGARLDLGRLANLAGTFIDRQLEPRVPYMLWRIPLLRRAYEAIIPAPDREQMRYNMRGWALEAAHDFDRSGPVVGISKRLGSKGDIAAAVSYDTAGNSAGLELRARGLVAAAKLGRQEDGAWRNPTLQLLIQPLAFL